MSILYLARLGMARRFGWHVHMATPNQCWIGIYVYMVITLFRSITVFYGTTNILWNVIHIQSECGEYFADDYLSHKTQL